MYTPQQAQQELAIRELEARHEVQRENFYEFLIYYRRVERKQILNENRHIKKICEKLEDVFYGRIKRLMINIPPRSLKTEIVSIAYPARCLWKRNNTKFMDISYATGLAQQNSMACRQIYKSQTFQSIFPRSTDIKDDLDTQTHRETKEWGQYYASWSTGTITGLWCDIMIIDDPLKPWDAMSDVVRIWVNNNYHNTLYSRLNNKSEWAIIIIMQRLHDDDLCGHLLDKEAHWEKREKLIVKAIADEDDEFRKQGESFFEKMFPVKILNDLKYWEETRMTFSSQYQQEPTNKETQEFHEEWFKYYDEYPKWLRTFTVVDPAFKQNQENDNTAIITVGFIEDKAYILELTAWKFPADVMQDKIIYHIKKRSPEKVGIEAFQAQSMIITFLKSQLQKLWMHVLIEEITQTGDKLSKIRKLLPLYRNWLIYHPRVWVEWLENEAIKFPRGKHDDQIDVLQMAYNLYELQPNNGAYKQSFTMKWDESGNPYIADNTNNFR